MMIIYIYWGLFLIKGRATINGAENEFMWLNIALWRALFLLFSE